MHGIGKSCGVAAAFVFAAGAVALLPTEAAAQFGIPNLPFFIPHPYVGPYHQSHPASHSRSSSRHDEDKGETSDKNKEKDATQEQPSGNAQHQQDGSSPAHESSRSVESDAPASPVGANKTYDDQPAFSPSR